MKMLVTGGAGFIGSHLVDRLVTEGHQVTVFDNLSSGKLEFLREHLERRYFRLVKADLLSLEDVKRGFVDHEIVFHFSANPDARRGIENTRLDLEQETIATYNVLEAMRINGIKKIVFSSSGTVYGETPVIPLPENYGPLLTASLYGAGKLASEALISSFCYTFGMQAWLFRFANIVGSRLTHGVIFDFINKLKRNPHELEILGDGTQCKPYLHVQECVDGVMFGVKHASDKVNLFNLGTATTSDVTSIAKTVIEEMGLTGVRLKYTGGDRGWPGDIPQVRFNVEKMARLGWKASNTSDEAVRKTIRQALGKE